MCLVSYAPTSNGFILTSNRDEFLERRNVEVKHEAINGVTVSYPAEILGGSWIFTSDQATLCLLNGAFENHKRELPYTMSRGIMMKSFYDHKDHIDFLANFKFKGIEPFTMIIVLSKKLLEFRWDGSLKHITNLESNKPHVWSSCTLYNDEMIAKRAQWFFELYEKAGDINDQAMLTIHQQGGVDNSEYGFIMNRQDIVATISMSQVISTNDKSQLVHRNL